MASPNAIRQRAIREQSAALAASLAAAGKRRAQPDSDIPDDAFDRALGEPQAEGGTAPRPATANERWMLSALAAAGGKATPAQLIEKHRDRYPGSGNPDGPQIRSAASSLHRIGSSLVSKGWAKRGRQQVRGASGQVQGAARLYRITAEGRQQL